ncbi:MAG: adenylate/guanylate cyclase domain-containing protein [Methylocystis sp.]|uniref:adenylate/guanylate cyclase domain-containing protein n=1 Tax=Methylocystis sp. TaxID=1911079 RepID=UPI003D106805
MKRLLQFQLAGTLAFAGIITAIAFMLNQFERRVEDAQRQRYDTYLLADELRQSSDDLTRFARMYVATADDRYLRYYWNILDIRNGKIPRPEGYEGVYWDLVVGNAIPEPLAEKKGGVSLEARLLQAGMTVDEFSKLKEAQNLSNELARLETVAMNAIRGQFDDGTGSFQKQGDADPVLANKILNDDRYNNYKTRIMQPIGEFLSMVDRRTTAQLEELNRKSQELLVGITGLSAAFFALMCLMVWLLSRNVLGRSAALMQAVHEISAGNLDARTDVSGKDEIGVLGSAIDAMANNLKAAIDRANNKAEEAREQAVKLSEERHHSEKLLNNILPGLIADRLRKGESMIAETFPEVTVLFADIVGFTELSARLGPREIVNMLNDVFGRFDKLVVEYGLEKIKTIGDCYMVVGGVPARDPLHCQKAADFAIAALHAFEDYASDFAQPLSIRIGMHTGTVVAGVVGTQKFAYDLWGDVVNVASRFESSGKPNRIHVSDSVRFRLADDFAFEEGEDMHLKGKGVMKSWFMLGRKDGRNVVQLKTLPAS